MIPTVEIVGVAQAAPVLEFAAPLPVPIIVEPGDESPTRSPLQRQKADLQVIPCNQKKNNRREGQISCLPRTGRSGVRAQQKFLQ